MSSNLFVANLPYALEEEELSALFTPYADVKSAKIITDRETGRSRGFGFVELASSEAGAEAIEGLHGTKVQGRAIVVRVAEPRQERGGQQRRARD